MLRTDPIVRSERRKSCAKDGVGPSVPQDPTVVVFSSEMEEAPASAKVMAESAKDGVVTFNPRVGQTFAPNAGSAPKHSDDTRSSQRRRRDASPAFYIT